MSLEFEQLTAAVAEMAREVGLRRNQQVEKLNQALALLHEYAAEWDLLEQRLAQALRDADEKFYRSARPLHREIPIDSGISAPPPPQRASIIATDGSQIVPDRHASFLYYLINVGRITYYHGSGRPPDVASRPSLSFPRGLDTEEEDAFQLNSGLVSILRDQAEIEFLAEGVRETAPEPGPTLAILDQRLLYWPIGNIPDRRGDRVVEAWQLAMSAVRAEGGLLAGFIDRPGKRSVLTMLYSLELEESGRKISDLYGGSEDVYGGLTDTDLFDAILQPGERSVVFVDISQHNTIFARRDPGNEVCFFYLKTGPGEGQLARVDIPLWVAADKRALGDVHGLLVDQCGIIGAYPYVITRADEIAVVGRRDQEELENRIALRLAELDIHTTMTAKQQAKEYARGEKTRFQG